MGLFMTMLKAMPVHPSPATPPAPPKMGPVAHWWLRRLFAVSRQAPWLARILKRWAARTAIRYSPKALDAAIANGRRLISPDLPEMDCREYGRSVVRRFIDFVIDIGRSQDQTPAEMRARIDGVDGHDRYAAARKLGRGAIILTAHMGSFELGLAALTAIEPKVHVVFKRDTEDGFEAIRQNLRQKLGVIEAPIDDGWAIWIKLRDALRADEVVVLQGDRALPGQKAQSAPVAGGHVALPLGPLMLAMASDAPIVPIFTLATAPGRCRVIVEEAIIVDPQAEPVNGVHPALLKIAKVIEKYVVAHPDQWLVLDRAFVEDVAEKK